MSTPPPPPQQHARAYLAHVGHRAAPRNVLVRDVSDDSVEPNPRVHSGLNRQDQLEQLVLGVGHVRALSVPLVDDRPRHHAARVDLFHPSIHPPINQGGWDYGRWDYVIYLCAVDKKHKKRFLSEECLVSL